MPGDGDVLPEYLVGLPHVVNDWGMIDAFIIYTKLCKHSCSSNNNNNTAHLIPSNRQESPDILYKVVLCLQNHYPESRLRVTYKNADQASSRL